MAWDPLNIGVGDGDSFVAASPKVWNGIQWVDAVAKISDGDFTTTPPGGDVARFPGDPGLGNVYIGGAPDWRTYGSVANAIENWNRHISDPLAYRPGTTLMDIGLPVKERQCGIFRTFNSGPPSDPNWNEIDAIIAAGAIPNTTFKLNPVDIAAGVYDNRLRNIGDEFIARAPWPIWVTHHHEPEDNYGSRANALAYREAHRRMVNIWRDQGVDNIAIVTTHYMLYFTWSSGSSERNPWAWYPDLIGDPDEMWADKHWNPSPDDFYVGDESTIDAIGVDHYTNWRGSHGLTAYQNRWAERFDVYWDRASSALPEMKPTVVGETTWSVYSPTADDNNQDVTDYQYGETRKFMRNLYPFFAQRDIVGVQYFNTTQSQTVPWDTRLDRFDDAYIRNQIFGEWADQPTTKLWTP